MTESKSAVARDEEFTQVCVWPGTVLGDSTTQDLVDFFKKEMGIRIQYLEEFVTPASTKNGRKVPDTGGRVDQIFAVHREDVSRFTVLRLQMGIRWIEDYIDNDREKIAPSYFTDYRSWDSSRAAQLFRQDLNNE